MVYCVQAELAFSNAARRDAVLANLQSFLTGRARWGAELMSAVPTVLINRVPVTGFGLLATVRFVSSADAQGLLAQLEAFATGVRVPSAGSRVRIHDCPHDGAGQLCAVGSTRVW